jgi:hypothetical protein
MFHKPRELSTVKVVNSIQIDIIDRHTIDAGRVTAAAAAPHPVSPVFLKKLLCPRANQAMERKAVDCSAR